MRKGLNNIQWCPGCGNIIIISAIKKAFDELNIPSYKRVIVSGIGCSGKASQYIDGYGAETLHGRSIPFATGVKIMKPDMKVLVISGDGDGYGIGIGHFIHACKRNIDITYLVFNNENYALTTGQTSPTTPKGVITKTTPNGNIDNPLNPIDIAKKIGVNFVKQISSDDYLALIKNIKEAISFKGFSYIDIKQKCPSFKKWN